MATGDALAPVVLVASGVLSAVAGYWLRETARASVEVRAARADGLAVLLVGVATVLLGVALLVLPTAPRGWLLAVGPYVAVCLAVAVWFRRRLAAE
ncbi:hypothetical protein [Halarchaeum sp. P4]|uniref:hypothetical protein n=1 Tax=Halarchaeum sp. P4 TaxID=3421639 RepID=UPI003EBE9D11